MVKAKPKSAPKPKRATSKQAIAMAQQVQQNKKRLLAALEKSLGVVTTACRNVGVDRTTHYRYLKDDADYAAAVKDLDDVALDFAESQLHKQIQAGNPTSTIFYLKTKGKNRGYIETSLHEHSGRGGAPIEQKYTVEVVNGCIGDGTRDNGQN